MNITDVVPDMKVRVLRNRCNAHKPDSTEIAVKGDILILTGRIRSTDATSLGLGIDMKVATYYQKTFGENFILLDDIEPISDSEGVRKCHCPPENFRLNGVGCQCGGV
jgi:hypothetical protein